MILGAYPALADVATGQSGSGAVGDYLQMILAKAGFCPDQLYYTSMAKCRDNDRAPTEGELTACLPHLRTEIKIVHPMTILGLGESVVRVIRGAIDDEKEKPEKDRRAHSLSDRGWVQWEKTPILFTLPPAFLMVEKNEGTLREKKRRVWEDVTKVMAQVRALTI
jgi:uracil-DNA glycosylase family 4